MAIKRFCSGRAVAKTWSAPHPDRPVMGSIGSGCSAGISMPLMICHCASCARSAKRKKAPEQKGKWKKKWVAQASTDPFDPATAKQLFPEKKYCSIDRAPHMGRWIAKWGWGPSQTQCELQ